MQKILLLILVLVLIPSVYAGIHNITIGTDTLYCGDNTDSICPSDYADCGNCVNDFGDVNDLDCCNSCTFWCTHANVVCGDSTDELPKDETDSAGSIVGSGDEEDCYTDAIPCTTEHVIDDSNDQACVDTYYNGTPILGYDYTNNCADDGILFHPYTYTSYLCQEDISCRDTDDTGDMEICDAGNWHDPDELSIYCTAVGGTWTTTDTGDDPVNDDYNGLLDDGYCDGDDGYIVTGEIVGETYRGSSHCEALDSVTVSIKDIADTTHVYDTDTTTISSTEDIIGCQESGNDVGTYRVTLELGTYYLVAEKAGYNTVTQTITIDSADQQLGLFWMYKNAECQSDCTMNDRICHAECAGVNECTYATYETESVATYCDGLRDGTRYVLSEIEDPITHTISGDQVYCCIGELTEYEREYFTVEDVETSCVENIISKKKAITVNGEVLDVHFVLFSDPKPEKTGCAEYQDFACNVYGDAFC